METILTIAIYFALLVIGFIIGIIFKRKNKVDGLLNVDTRDEEKDYYDFVFLIPTGDIPKRKYLTIEVKTK